MFMIGQHIQVIASSQIAAGAKVRVGSTGFISNIIDSILIEKLKVGLVLCDVVFNRYGFEKKSRCESKKVIIVLPYKDPILTNSKLKIYLRKTIISLVDSTATVIKLLRLTNFKIKSPIFIVVTHTNIDIYKSKETYRAWFLSIYKNRTMIEKRDYVYNDHYNETNVLFENFTKKFLAQKKYTDVLNFADICYDKINNNVVEYIEFINLLKTYIQLINLKNMNIAIKITNFSIPTIFNIISALYFLMSYKLGAFSNKKITINTQHPWTNKLHNYIHYWLLEFNKLDLTKP